MLEDEKICDSIPQNNIQNGQQMIKRIFILLLSCFLSKLSNAQTPSWNTDVSCIVYSHCSNCHNPNGLAPFSLMNYAEVYARRNSILQAVQQKRMPPYLPNTDYSHFAREKKLTPNEIEKLTIWINAGAPEGNATPLQPPSYDSHQEAITAPDISAQIPTFTVPATGNDLYQAFVITGVNATAKYLKEIEIVPGNRNIVHHVLVFQDTSSTPVIKDSAYAGPGYVSFGGIGSNTAKLIATWVPGSDLYRLPPGMGIKLDASSRIILQIHYPADAAGQTDSTKINLKYDLNPLRNVNISSVLNSNNLVNGPLFIPANTTKTFHAIYTVNTNVSAILVGPHAHLLCKRFECYGLTPQNDTIKLIKIDDWDFHWQGMHPFQKPIKIPAGTVLHGFAYYDNTTANPENPNSPPQDVRLGEATTDEMMLIYFGYLLYQAGDENIIIDTASHGKHYLDCKVNENNTIVNNSLFAINPNPVSGVLHIYPNVDYGPYSVAIFNATGQLVFTATNEQNISVSHLPRGVYFACIVWDGRRYLRKFLKE